MLELMAAIPRSNPNYFLILEVNSAISKSKAESATLLAELESKQRQQQFLRDQELAKKLQRQENLRQQQALSAHDAKMAALRKARGLDDFAEKRMKQTKMMFRGDEAGTSKARNADFDSDPFRRQSIYNSVICQISKRFEKSQNHKTFWVKSVSRSTVYGTNNGYD